MKWIEDEHDRDSLYRGTDANGIKAINEAMNLMESEKAEIDKHTRLHQLTKEDLAYQIRHNINYLWFDYFLEDAKKWVVMRDKCDKRKKYTEKQGYDYLVRKLKEIFDVETIDILQFRTEGYDKCATWCEFTTDDDYIYYLIVPTIKNITHKNMEDLSYGQIRFGYYSNPSCMRTVAHSYDATTFRQAMIDMTVDEDCYEHMSKTEWKGE